MSSDDEEPFQRKELRAGPSSAASSSAPALGDKRKELRAPAEPVIEEVAEGNSSLQQAWKKTKTSGKGVAILERLSHHLANEEGDFEKTGFIQVRLVGPRAKKQTKKPVRPKDGEKNLRYADCTPEIQKGLRRCRAEEWQKWMKFNAGVVISQEEVDLLMSEGVKILPMQWVETDKNAHKRRHNVKVPPLLKSRLVGCGNFEDTEGLRTDSPTADVDAHNLVFSWTASSRVKIRSADITSAYLQGKEVDRIILYRIPKGGIPAEGLEEGTVIATRVPIYGTKDAGRGFWLKLKEVVIENGLKLNNIMPTLFSLRDKNDKIIGMLTTNVDDLLYSYKPEGEEAFKAILEAFKVRAQDECSGSVAKKSDKRRIPASQ